MVVSQLIGSRLQVYQTQRDTMSKDSDMTISPRVLAHIIAEDDMFFSRARPYCQSYLNCYITKYVNDDGEFSEFGYGVATKATTARKEFANARMSNTAYALMRIKRLVESSDDTRVFDHMVQSGMITDKDVPSLTAIANAQAK